MNRTRWKLMIGALGLSLGGVAVLAGDPTSAGAVSCSPTPTHTAQRAVSAAQAGLKTSPSVQVSALAPPEGIPALPAPTALPLPIERVSAAAPAKPAIPEAPPTIPVIPTLAAPAPIPALPAPPTPVKADVPSLPPLPAPPKVDLPAPKKAETPKPIDVSFEPVPAPARPTPAPVAAAPKPEMKPLPAPAAPPLPKFETPAPIAAEPKPTPAPVAAKPAPTAEMKPGEKRMKAILFLSDDRPRFEVRDGDEVYLRVVADKVDVQSPGAGGVNVSTMRATSRVTFVTPGGEGTCDELAVLPGTGQVVVTGKVSFTYNWGRVETTVSGEKMTFRLGSNAPETAPTSGTIPARFTESK